jgi:hypothetical protein
MSEDNGPDGMMKYWRVISDPQAHRDDPNWPLPSFDARDWAKSFCETAAAHGHSGIDEEWMVTWFANALMRGYDEHAMRMASIPLDNPPISDR